MSGTSEARAAGFYWVILNQGGQPEVAFWDSEQSEWWLCGEPRPRRPEAVTVVGERLVFKPKLTPVA